TLHIMKMQLIKGWRTFWRWWSTWLSGASTIFLFLPEITEHLLYAYSIIPMDIKATFPDKWSSIIGATLGVAAFLSRFITQPKVQRKVYGPEADGKIGRAHV